MKTIRMIIIVVAFCAALFAFASFAYADSEIIDSGTCGADGDNITWTLDSEGVLVISGEGEMESYYYDNLAPWCGENVNKVVLGGTITNIGDFAFYNCTRLAEISIPDSLTSIGDYAFQYCSSMTGIIIPDSVTSIGEGAFLYCINLTGIAIPGSVTSIEGLVLSECRSLTSITIPDSVTSIGVCAFSGCSSLTNIIIPDSVTIIGDHAFSDCRSLTSITIPDSVSSIGDDAFYLCSSLTNIIIPDSVTSIGNYAFYGCSSLTNIIIPDSVTSIGVGTFAYCTNLEIIYVDENNNYYLDYDGVLYNNGIQTIICCPAGKSGEIAIVDGTTAIGDLAFEGCGNLTTIMIPDSVTSIGDCAFSHCSSLTNIMIPASATSIGVSAFYGCSSLTSITVPDGVTIIETGTFGGCTGLTEITIPDGVTSIGDSAFCRCSSLTNIVIPDSVTRICSFAFSDCTNLAEMVIPNGVISIDYHAFSGCSNLKTIVFPESLESIDERWFFSGCDQLSAIYVVKDSLADNVFKEQYGEIINYYDFYSDGHCYSETIITEPTCTESGERICTCVICGYSFYELIPAGHKWGEWQLTTPPTCVDNGIETRICENDPTHVETRSVDATGHEWGEGVVTTEPTYYSTGVMTYTCTVCGAQYDEIIPQLVYGGTCGANGDNITWTLDNEGVLTISGEGEMIDFESDNSPWFSQRDNIQCIRISRGVTRIGEWAFYKCSGLTSVTIPDSLTSIGNYAFFGCSSLTNIIIPDGVTSIGGHAFSLCSSLTNIIIPDSVTSIGNCAFYGCSSMTNIIIPKNVAIIGVMVFYHCTNLANIYVDENNKFYSDYDGVLYKDDIASLICCPSGKSGEITIVDGTNAIGEGAFFGCSSLTNIIIPDGVVSIGRCAFEGCSSLTSVTIPDSLNSIGNSAFYGCSSLTNIMIPDGVTDIGDYAFFKCSSLTNITIPKNVANIGDLAFYRCTNLANIYVDEDNNFYSDYDGVLYKAEIASLICCPSGKSGEITIVDGTTTIEDRAFDGCSSLTNIMMPESVTNIGYYSFFECSSLESITIPNGVTSIGDDAFGLCSSLASITIPDSVTNIGGYAFYNCDALKYIFFGGTREQWDNLDNKPTSGIVHYSSTDHTLGAGEVISEPTCTAEGISCKQCIVDNCDYSMTESIPALGHAWGGWAVTTAPGCETDGEETRVCANDNSHVETRVIAAIGHDWGDWAVTTAPDCETDGEEARVCANDNSHVETRVIPSIGHDWDEGTVIKEPTYSDEGLILYTCKNDPNHTYTEVLPKLDRPDESIILRIAGSNRSATAIEAAKQLKARKGIEKFDNIVIASGTGFADALSASYLAYKKDGPILLVDKSSITTVTDFVNENLATGGKVFIVGGEGAVSMEVDANIIAGSGNNSVVRLAGKDRYLTNIMVLNEAGVAGENLLVASGTGFADALSASAAKKPIFLVGKSLSDSQKTYLNSHKSSLSGKYYVIGGTGAVTQDVEDALTSYGTVQRLQGSDRYATSIAVADEFFPGNVDTVVVAFGTNFPDGLSGGPIAAAYDAPLILVTDKNYAHAVKQFAEKNAFQLVVMGGTGVISDDTAQKIAYNLQ